MLFARLQRQRVRAATRCVLARADETAGHLSEKRLTAGKQSRSHPVGRRKSERRGVADDDVRTGVCGRLQNRERNRIGTDHEQRVVVVGQSTDRFETFLDHAADRRRLGVHEKRLVVDGRFERIHVGDAIIHRIGIDIDIVADEVAFEGSASAVV